MEHRQIQNYLHNQLEIIRVFLILKSQNIYNLQQNHKFEQQMNIQKMM